MNRDHAVGALVGIGFALGIGAGLGLQAATEPENITKLDTLVVDDLLVTKVIHLGNDDSSLLISPDKDGNISISLRDDNSEIRIDSKNIDIETKDYSRTMQIASNYIALNSKTISKPINSMMYGNGYMTHQWEDEQGEIQTGQLRLSDYRLE